MGDLIAKGNQEIRMGEVMPRMENWSVVDRPEDRANVFLPPECRKAAIHGEVYGHPSYPNGDLITTSPIVAVEGNKVECASRTYTLGKPSAEYVEWCLLNGYHVPTDEVPIKWEKKNEATNASVATN
jgi:hypothetical protein